MKRFILALLLLGLLLSGCAAEAPAQEVTTLPTTAVTEPAPTLPVGLYDPDSSLEAETAGGVKVYPLGMRNVRDVRPIQNSLLILAGGENDTTFTLLSGDTLYPEKSITVDTYLYAGDLQFHGSSISYFHPAKRQTQILNFASQQVHMQTIDAPEDLVGTPMLSRDQRTLYYCTAGTIRALDLESGISRLLKEVPYQEMSITGLHLQDSVLKVQLVDRYGFWRSLYLSTEDGRTFWEDSGELLLYGSQDQFFANYYEGTYPMHLFGTTEGEPYELFPLHPEASCFYLPEGNVVTSSYTGEAQVLDHYDLDSGLRTGALSFPTDHYIHSITEGYDGRVYFLCYSADYDCDVLYGWDPAMTPSGDSNIYTRDYHPAESPDFAGLEECAAYARSLSEKYGVEILIYKDAAAIEPIDYHLEPEHNVTVIRRELEFLDNHLSHYPAGFLQTLAEHFDGIRIGIVKALEGSAEAGSLDSADGVQFFDGYTACIALAAHRNTEYALYHEMCHLVESVVLTESTAYDRWDTLNPKDFAYDYDYVANVNRDGSAYLQRGSEYFIDTYSMSYPKEDRARIMEYAMTEGNEAYFQSRAMQAKLLTLCQAIRDAFGLKKNTETFLWEQYLTTSLAYSE